jgi:quercetin dioxygenase-like cupin family protein
MITASTGSLELIEGWHASDPQRARLRFTFPINRLSGARASSVVYFEVPPGQRLPRHTDSAEEILYIVEGTAEVELGEERGTVRAGDLAVIPELVPHGLVNVGEDTVRVVGWFASEAITSEFEEPMEPFGATVFEQAPLPEPARA